MSLEDWIVTDEGRRIGGQGTVAKVRHRVDGHAGALKLMHETRQTERRYRFLAEVSGLRAMAANGVPAVLEANERGWENPDIELYLVMDLIDGPTVQELVQKSPPTLDQALAATRRILAILDAGHQLPLLHRDLKPDNVILRHGKWEDPVLVDFGIAWYRDHPDVDFRTPDGSELGNRFLRLPEFAPGGEHHDLRSDVAMAAGLLFFMLSGRAPRTPVNADGRHPHEVTPSPIRPAVLEDLRWPKLNRLLRVAFQQRIEARFQSAQEFSAHLNQLDGDKSVPIDDLDAEIARYIETTSSAVARERSEAAPAMEQASQALYVELNRIWTGVGLQQGGQNPTFKNGGATNEFYCVVSRQGQADPAVVFRHIIELLDGRLRASWSIDGAGSGLEFDGSTADGEGLREALVMSARKLSSGVIRELTHKLTPPADLRPFFKQ
ncbi:protein kinase domain-containing protein [Mesorhizobium shangrilense]|uniref:Protein kinase domain-containing protein n=1 Tax=Mesorhizobium shangrilense TaxID=460060 RepID=A0ABV2DHA6_9HYPH